MTTPGARGFTCGLPLVGPLNWNQLIGELRTVLACATDARETFIVFGLASKYHLRTLISCRRRAWFALQPLLPILWLLLAVVADHLQARHEQMILRRGVA
jgi:hypothetical protein